MRKSIVSIVTACVAIAIVSPCRAEERSAAVFKYLAARAAKLAGQGPAPAAAPSAWEQRRSELAKGLAVSLGLPPREAMKAAVTYQKQEGDLVIEEVVFHWAGGTYASGHVIRLKARPHSRPGLVICPGDLAHYTWRGYRELVEHSARAGLVVLLHRRSADRQAERGRRRTLRGRRGRRHADGRRPDV